eukprot:2466308-Rhodomonas_salina.1
MQETAFPVQTALESCTRSPITCLGPCWARGQARADPPVGEASGCCGVGRRGAAPSCPRPDSPPRLHVTSPTCLWKLLAMFFYSVLAAVFLWGEQRRFR